MNKAIVWSLATAIFPHDRPRRGRVWSRCDKRDDHQFTSAISPPYLRRVAALDNLIPALYLKGVSMAQMVSALKPILGEKAGGLSLANIQRLLGQWQKDHRQWEQRGRRQAPKVAIGNGALGFSAALEEEYPQARGQRCWVHKTANVLKKLPQRWSRNGWRDGRPKSKWFTCRRIRRNSTLTSI